MATITIVGMDQAFERIEKMTQAMEPVFEKAAGAGGKLMAERVSEAAPRRTGGLSKSVRAGTVKHTIAEGFHSTVEMVGSDPHGEPYAKIANILEYSATRGRPFFYAAADAATDEVRALMAGIIREELGK